MTDGWRHGSTSVTNSSSINSITKWTPTPLDYLDYIYPVSNPLDYLLSYSSYLLNCPSMMLLSVISISCCSNLTRSLYFCCCIALLDCTNLLHYPILLFIPYSTYVALCDNLCSNWPVIALLHFCLDLQLHLVVSVLVLLLHDDIKVESESESESSIYLLYMCDIKRIYPSI